MWQAILALTVGMLLMVSVQLLDQSPCDDRRIAFFEILAHFSLHLLYLIFGWIVLMFGMCVVDDRLKQWLEVRAAIQEDWTEVNDCLKAVTRLATAVAGQFEETPSSDLSDSEPEPEEPEAAGAD